MATSGSGVEHLELEPLLALYVLVLHIVSTGVNEWLIYSHMLLLLLHPVVRDLWRRLWQLGSSLA